jgi:hypothetical protein
MAGRELAGFSFVDGVVLRVYCSWEQGFFVLVIARGGGGSYDVFGAFHAFAASGVSGGFDASNGAGVSGGSVYAVSLSCPTLKTKYVYIANLFFRLFLNSFPDSFSDLFPDLFLNLFALSVSYV